MNFNSHLSFPLLSVAILCFLTGSLTYLNTLHCGIVYDDEPAIKKNPDLRPQSPWYNLLHHDFWGGEMTSTSSHKSYRPLCVATYRLNYLMHKLEPMGYHLVNVLLHGSVCFMYVFLCGAVFRDVWPTLLAGVMFSVHPIHTEAVAGLVGRTELLSAFFFISAFLAYRQSIFNNNHSVSLWFFLSLFCSLCSVLSKEQGITVVALCTTYEFFVVRKMDWNRSLLLLRVLASHRQDLPRWFTDFMKRTILLAAFTLVFIALRVYMMEGGPNIFQSSVNPPLHMSTPYRQLSWLHLIFVNSWLLVNPSFLCPDWRFGLSPTIQSLTDPRNLLSITTLAILAALGVYSIRNSNARTTKLFFGVALTVLPFIPASNLFFPVGFVVAERVLYTPSMGYCFTVSFGAYVLFKSRKNVFFRAFLSLLFSALLVLLTARAVARNEEWESNFTLYSSGVRCNPGNGVMLTNLGIQHGKLKNFTYAEKLYRRSIAVAPDHSRGYSNLGGLLEALKRYDESEEYFKKAVLLGVHDSTGSAVIETYAFLINKVILRKGSRRYQDALDLWDQALETYPQYAQLYGYKGCLLYKMGRLEEAVSLLEVAAKSEVMFADVYYYLGLFQMREGSGVRTGIESKMDFRSLFRQALQIEPNHNGALTQLQELK